MKRQARRVDESDSEWEDAMVGRGRKGDSLEERVSVKSQKQGKEEVGET